MTVITRNGWPQCGRTDCEQLFVPGTEDNAVSILLRRGAVGTILIAWAAWFHRNVRTINIDADRNWQGWCARHEVAGSAHLSGSAADLCTSELPGGQHTMPSSQVRVVHRGLALFEGTVFWGRWWDQSDEAHFEIWLPPAHPRIGQFADRLSGGYLDLLRVDP